MEAEFSEQELFLSWEDVFHDSMTLGLKLREIAPWKGIVAITRGGLIPAAIVARAIEVKIIETIGLSSYSDETKTQHKIEVIKNLDGIEQEGEGWLVIDDLVDTGATAQQVRSMLPKAYIGVVYAKPQGTTSADAFAVSIAQHTWIHFPWEY